jgi:hypothetical protein
MFRKVLILTILAVGLSVVCSFGGQVPAKPARSIGMVTDAHTKVHLGQIYRTGHLYESVAAGATSYFMVDVATTGFTADEIHATLTIVSSVPVVLNIYRAPITTSSGTVVPSYNLNQNIADSATAIMYHTPTITSNGTKISPTILIPATANSFISDKAFKDGAEYVGADSLYLITVRNVSAQTAADIGIYADFYEQLQP